MFKARELARIGTGIFNLVSSQSYCVMSAFNVPGHVTRRPWGVPACDVTGCPAEDALTLLVGREVRERFTGRESFTQDYYSSHRCLRGSTMPL